MFSEKEKRIILNLKNNNSFGIKRIYKYIRPGCEMSNEEFMEIMDIFSQGIDDTTKYITEYDLTDRIAELKKTMSREEIYMLLLSERVCYNIKKNRFNLSRRR